jgi:hypothetical protein
MRLLHSNENLRIEDPLNHAGEALERLRVLLLDGAAVREDPHRESFYEVHDESVVYYIHMSPATGVVYLLAAWPKLAASVSA